MSEFPFTAEQFFEVFASYNRSVWPWQFVLALIASAVTVLTWRRPAAGQRMVPIVLAILWVWSGLAYHLAHFARVNTAAYLFAALFSFQGMLWIWAAVRGRLHFASSPSIPWTIGAMGILYSLVIYPLLGSMLGHRYPAAPTFGAPCPITIFTFGILLWTRPPVPLRLVVIPFLWAVLTAPMALGWGVLQDSAMPLIAVTAAVLLVLRNRKAFSVQGARPSAAGVTAALT